VDVRRLKRRKRRKLPDRVREIREAVEEVDSLLDVIKRIVCKIGVGVEKIEKGEVIDYGDKVLIVQRTYGYKPKVRYKGGIFYITLNDHEFVYEVGEIDKESINAVVKNDILTIECRRCEHVEETEKSVQEEEGGGSEGSGFRGSETRSGGGNRESEEG